MQTRRVVDSRERPSVVRVAESALAGDYAMVSGYPAWLVAQLLERYPGGLDAVLDRSRLTDEQRRSVLRAVSTLSDAGARYQVGRSVSVSGSVAGEVKGASASSTEMPLTACESATLLGISDRRIRQLAGAGEIDGSRDSSGRWVFTRAAIAEFSDRRAA